MLFRSSDDVPLPDSPWAVEAKSAAPAPAGVATATPASAAGGTAAGAPPAPTPWLSSPDEAWDRARSTQRPIVVYFHVPRSKLCQSFESFLQTDAAVSAQMANLVRLRVDLNTLPGGMIGQKFQIYRIPSFVILTPDGKEVARQVFAPDILHEEVVATLQKANAK